MAFTAKMNSKLPKEPIQTTEGDLKLLLKYKVCGWGGVCRCEGVGGVQVCGWGGVWVGVGWGAGMRVGWGAGVWVGWSVQVLLLKYKVCG